jgi:NAD(P)-dependent dehydrogenase (short-subunit alcohol dehydrogenase family)
MDLTDKNAVVIGGSSGMGRGAARALAARGAHVLVTSRSQESADAAARALSTGLEPVDGGTSVGSVVGVACDLLDPASLDAAFADVTVVDVLVVTAAPAVGVSDQEFFDGKFWGTRRAADLAVPRMPADGVAVFASGGLAVQPAVGTWAVTCAFAAVEALARALAVEHGPRRFVCVRPGLFDTASWSHLSDEARSRLIERADSLPAGRAATEDDFGDAVVAVLGMRYLTGQVVTLDGGRALVPPS